MPNARIELRLRELSQLFNSMDPSPFHEKDLDTDAEEFIVAWARELPADRDLEVVIHLSQPLREDRTVEQTQHDVEEALANFFAHKADHERRVFSELMRNGRTTLTLGLGFLSACILASTLISSENAFLRVLSESLIIAGWVAMWRPLEIFLYDWWPIRTNVRLYRRLSAARTQLRVPAPSA